MSTLEIAITAETAYSMKALNATTKTIYSLCGKSNENQLGIAWNIAKAAEYWNNDGKTPEEFANVHEWTASAFGIKKSQSYDYLNVGRRFIEKTEKGKYQTIFHKEGFAEFTISQLVEMLKIETNEELTELIENGVINPAMSVRDIAKTVKSYNECGDDETDESETAEKEPETPETVTITADSGESITIPRKVFDRLVKKYSE